MGNPFNSSDTISSKLYDFRLHKTSHGRAHKTNLHVPYLRQTIVHKLLCAPSRSSK